MNSLGIDSFVEAAERELNGAKTWQDELKEKRELVAQKLKDGAITLDQANSARRDLTKAEEMHKEADRRATQRMKADEMAQRRNGARSRLGVDSLMESLKTPMQKYLETLDDIQANAEFFSVDEIQALKTQAFSSYRDALKGTKGGQFAEEENERRKATAGQSMGAGSDAFYKALIARTAPLGYQNAVQRNTAKMVDAQEEGVSLAQEQCYYLEQMATGLNALGNQNFPVFG